jgi:hypothetical protein
MGKRSLLLLAAGAVLVGVPAFAQIAAANNPITSNSSGGTTTLSAPVTQPAAQSDSSLDQVVCRTTTP